LKEDGQMEIKITQQSYNPLLKRREVVFELDHAQTRGTPSRLEIRKALTEMLKTNLDVVYVKLIETKAGTMLAKGEANAYDSAQQARIIEPKYIIARNIPEEKQDSAEKTETPKQPAQKEE
jgi:small subunit ribosomal protein S24e